MALPNVHVRTFPDHYKLDEFIKTDASVASILEVFQDNNGQYVLVYSDT